MGKGIGQIYEHSQSHFLTTCLNYRSVIGRILYIYEHTRPDIEFVVNCCIRYIFFPKHFQENALKRIGWYLKLTRYCGLILNLNRDPFKIVSYPGAHFAGMYGNYKPTDPTCVKSCTGYVITFSDCPVLCQSKVHTETYLLTTKTDSFALAYN